MNLSKKQLEVLVDEIYSKDVYPLMQKQVNDLRQELTKDFYSKLDHLKKIFIETDFIGFKSFVIDKNAILTFLWFSDCWNQYTTDSKDFDSLITSLVTWVLRTEYNKKYTKEIQKEDIERIIVLETIWAKSVEELIEAVSKKLNI